MSLPTPTPTPTPTPKYCDNKKYYFFMPQSLSGDPRIYCVGLKGTKVSLYIKSGIIDSGFIEDDGVIVFNLVSTDTVYYVESNASITCHFIFNMDYASNGTGLIPTDALSNTYYVFHYGVGYGSIDYGTQCNIIATENNTSITIELVAGQESFPKGRTINLNRLDCYYFKLESTTLTGSLNRAGTTPSNIDKNPIYKITSSKKISVMNSSVCFKSIGGCCNAQFVQIQGAENFDTKYLFPITIYSNLGLESGCGSPGPAPGDVMTILSIDDNNTITSNGSVIATLNKYETFTDINFVNNAIVESTHPIFIYQQKKGCRSNRLGDASVNAIYSINKIQKRYNISIPALFERGAIAPRSEYYALVGIKSVDISSLKINDTPTSLNSVLVGSGEYVVGYVDISSLTNYQNTKVATFSADSEFLLILDAYSHYDSYLFSVSTCIGQPEDPNPPLPPPRPCTSICFKSACSPKCAIPTPTPTRTPTPTPTRTPTPTPTRTPTPTPTTICDWVRVGQDVFDPDKIQDFGWNVQLDSSGTVLAASSFNYDFGKGYIKIYDYSSGLWNERGSSLVGNANLNQYGYSISLDEDGNSIASCARLGGYVNVHDWNSNTGLWVKRANDILVEGRSISMSRKRSSPYTQVLAIGSPSYDNVNFGKVRVYTYDNSQPENGWFQLGSTINGETIGDIFGHTVRISKDGNVLAVIADRSIPLEQNYIKIYSWNASAGSGGDWVFRQKIQNFGLSTVDLNNNGSILAIGYPRLREQDQNGDLGNLISKIEVYDWNGTTYIKRSPDITGINSIGYAISLNNNGTTLASVSVGGEIGSSVRHGGYVFDWILGSWVRRGPIILNQSRSGLRWGESICLDGSGSRLSVTDCKEPAGSFDTTDNKVRVYEFSCSLPAITPTPTHSQQQVSYWDRVWKPPVSG